MIPSLSQARPQETEYVCTELLPKCENMLGKLAVLGRGQETGGVKLT